MGFQFSFGDAMKHLTTIHMLLSALVVAAAVVATPVEHTNGVISINDEELALEFTTVNRGDCPDCNGLFLAYPYHLIDADERRGLGKRAPKKFKIISKKAFKGTKVPGFNKPFKFGKKNVGKSFKPGSPQNKAKKFGKKFGKKNFAKAKKPGTPQNKKAKGKGKKGGKKTKKGSPLTVPALGLGAPGGGAIAFGVPGTGFGGF